MSKAVNLKSVSPEEITMLSKPGVKNTQHKWQKKVFKVINGPIPQLILGLLLMMSLFLAESWVLGNAPDSSNDALYGILLAIFVIFMVETFVLSIVQEGYFLSFFFWMDLIGTLSIILDIGWIASYFLPQGALSSQGSVIRATRTAKLGARYGRLLRLIKMMRFLKYLPCFSSAEEDFEPTMKSIKKVSNELSAVLSLRTAALVLTIVIVEPFMSYETNDFSPNSWITNFKMIAKNETTPYYNIEFMGEKMQRFYEPKDLRLLKISVESPYQPQVYEAEYTTRDILRSDNIVSYSSYYDIANSTLAASDIGYAKQYLSDTESTIRFKVHVELDETIPNQWNALFGILIIVLTITMLFTFTASFNSAVNRLVVKPLETMMGTLRKSALVMLESMKTIANEKDKEEESKTDRKKTDEDDDSSDSEEEMETAMLDKMVEKLARIVKHVMPGANDIAVDANIDKTTANWLSQSYTTAFSRGSTKELPRTLTVDEERLRLEALNSTTQIVPREKLDSWEFNVLDYSNDDLCEAVVYIFSILNLLNEFSVPMGIFKNFLKELSRVYINENTYHNFKHGVDVCHTSYRLLVIPGLNDVFSELELFSTLVGAIAHDVGHPGVNNVFLVNSKHELALKHNDKSPLENMHCVKLYEILSKENTNIFMNLKEEQWREARKVILTIILGTDMSHHFEQISKTQLFLEVNGEDIKEFCGGRKSDIDSMKDEKNRLFIMELVLHCSDISNPYKPFALCEAWALLVVEEFSLQGDREKKEGLTVSPMCDRDTIVLCNMQMGFIEFVVAPLIIAFVNIFPPLHEIGTNMQKNYQAWGERRKGEIMIEDKVGVDKVEECRKLDERLGKFATRMSFANTFREQQQPRPKRASTINLDV